MRVCVDARAARAGGRGKEGRKEGALHCRRDSLFHQPFKAFACFPPNPELLLARQRPSTWRCGSDTNAFVGHGGLFCFPRRNLPVSHVNPELGTLKSEPGAEGPPPNIFPLLGRGGGIDSPAPRFPSRRKINCCCNACSPLRDESGWEAVSFHSYERVSQQHPPGWELERKKNKLYEPMYK